MVALKDFDPPLVRQASPGLVSESLFGLWHVRTSEFNPQRAGEYSRKGGLLIAPAFRLEIHQHVA